MLEPFSIGEPVSAPELSTHDRAALRRFHQAAREALDCQRVLKKVGLNLVGELLKGQGQFVQLDHYPKGDVYDRETGGQYYYHAHRGGEHGHFHLFNRPAGDNRPGKVKTPTHLVAVSMDAWGLPIGLFTTNRWVTGERWRGAAETLALAETFAIDHAWPSWPVNRWVTALVSACRPQLEVLLAHRDREIARLRAEDPKVFENREIEVIGQIPLDLPAWTEHLATTLKHREA
ncbi:DUF6969 family protein [Halomonas salifodinae]|uniref:DUF6969 family protein n=1 Tax=Halomonas salifodinae TaxID=438745 RepID=UPI0033BE0387